jgi:hypothetical protein
VLNLLEMSSAFFTLYIIQSKKAFIALFFIIYFLLSTQTLAAV